MVPSEIRVQGWVGSAEGVVMGYTPEYYAKNKERIIAQSRKWVLAHPEETTAYHKKYHQKWYHGNLEQRREEANQRYFEAKLETLTHYGPEGKLQCCWPDCGITDIDMLTLDHLHNNGAEDRRKFGKSTPYKRLRKDGFPEGFQTLCGSHQLKKALILARSRRKGGEK